MTLQRKTFYTIGITLLVLVLALDAVSRLVVLRSFVELERAEAAQNVQRVLSAISDNLGSLKSSNKDWAEWDDPHLFMQGKNPEFIETNVRESTSFLNLRVGIMSFVQPSGEITFIKQVDLETGEEVPVPEVFTKYITEHSFLYNHKAVGANVAGFVAIPSGFYLISSQAIVSSAREGPIAGAVIFARKFDSREIQHLSKSTLYALSVRPVGDPKNPADFQKAVPLLAGRDVVVRPLDSQVIAGYVLLKDVEGKPVYILRADTPRTVYAQGLATVAYFKGMLLAVTLLFGLMIILFIRTLVLRRITHLNEEMSRIAATGEASKRVSVIGKDELAGLSRAVNNMLGALERSRAELMKNQEKLREAQRMETVGKLAGGVAHDFNNLMTVISGYAEVLVSSLSPEDPARKDVGEILKASQRATKLTAQLLAFSRRQLMQAEVVSPIEVIRAKEEMWKQLAGESIELSILPPGEAGRVKVDAGQFEEALTNLILNACEAMPKGGRIVIETANVDLDENYSERHQERVASGSYVMVAVTDSGCGFSEELRPHLFEPFFTTKDKSKNAGLGLATAYGIVKQAGGYIFIYSEPGQGTTAKIYLPRVPERTPAAAAKNGEPPRGTETILLAEDEPMVRSLSARVLKEHGYHLLEAADGLDALKVATEFGQSRIDLLLTDVVMPKMGGKELADKLKTDRPGLKILFASGYTDEAIVRQGILDKSIPFIQKPFSPKLLVKKVREVLDQ
jgi:signal transduction histidine kinase/CheY-like chemotaxis protein